MRAYFVFKFNRRHPGPNPNTELTPRLTYSLAAGWVTHMFLSQDRYTRGVIFLPSEKKNFPSFFQRGVIFFSSRISKFFSFDFFRGYEGVGGTGYQNIFKGKIFLNMKNKKTTFPRRPGPEIFMLPHRGIGCLQKNT
jgi:hypothetical protein